MHRIENSIKEKFLGLEFWGLQIENVIVTKELQFVTAKRKQIQKIFRNKYNQESIKQEPRVKAIRELFNLMGISEDEPTAVENLTNLLFKSGLPNINSIVDSCNLASLATCMPVGVFDKDQIKGSMVLRFSQIGDKYEPIGRDLENVPENIIVLADDEGVIARPMYKDSKKTMITLNTKNIYIFTVKYGIISDQNCIDALNTAKELINMSSKGEAGEIFKFE